MYCTTPTFKYILYTINLCCALIGALLFWYGIWLIRNTITDKNFDHGENLAAVLCMLLAIVIILAAIFGSVGAFMESKTTLTYYAILLLLLLIIQMVMLSISYTANNNMLPAGLILGFNDLWDPKHVGNSTLEIYEEWLHCCGRNSAQDYFEMNKMPADSCCADRDCTNIYNLYIEGCEQKFRYYVQSLTGHFNMISWVLICVELSASMASCYLLDSIRNHRDRIRLYS